MLTRPWNLRWRDVDPTAIAFDLAPARAISERLLGGFRYRPQPGTTRDEHLQRLEDSVDDELVRAYGLWAAGWRWAASEPGCGGPVRAWCCARDSLPRADARDAIAGALADWRGWLESIAAVFRALDADTAGLAIPERVERAAARLLPIVIERTGCEDAWYQTFATTLSWYVERIAPGEEPSRWIQPVVKGRFASWMAPGDDVATATCGSLGATVGDRLAEPPATADALEAWRHTRLRVDWSRLPHDVPAVATVDGHMAYIETRDRPRDAGRADRLREALQHMRVRAAAGEPLTMSLLARCQQIVLGLDATPVFRIRDAFAKAGRERYSAGPEVARQFDRCLEEANGPAPAAVARAARVYLDVCFFHPFEDGNARAARLALDHVLTCAGLRLTVADPIFGFSRWADDALDAMGLLWMIARLARSVDTAAGGQAT
jgi:hypothetical protein